VDHLQTKKNVKQQIAQQEIASKHQKYDQLLDDKITGGIVTKDVIVHAVQQGLLITHHTVTTMD